MTRRWRTRPLGARGEAIASRHLRRGGHRVLLRNLRTSHGELDLVTLAPDRRTIVIVEVKTRAYGADQDAPPPEASVTATKREKLLELTERLLRRRGWQGKPFRIDVVAVEIRDGAKPSVRHFENAVKRDGPSR